MTMTRFLDQHLTERGHDFYPPAELLQPVPALYATEPELLRDKTIHLHFFVGSCDWWVIELDTETMLAWGYVCLGDPGAAEFGYIDLTELCGVRIDRPLSRLVERDLHWQPVALHQAHLPGLPSTH